jgi:hypothetical protein
VSSHRGGGSAVGQEASVLADGTDGSGRASGSAPTEGPRTPLVLPAHRASRSHISKGHARESQTPSQEVKPLAMKGWPVLSPRQGVIPW